MYPIFHKKLILSSTYNGCINLIYCSRHLLKFWNTFMFFRHIFWQIMPIFHPDSANVNLTILPQPPTLWRASKVNVQNTIPVYAADNLNLDASLHFWTYTRQNVIWCKFRLDQQGYLGGPGSVLGETVRLPLYFWAVLYPQLLHAPCQTVWKNTVEFFFIHVYSNGQNFFEHMPLLLYSQMLILQE